MEHQNGPDRVDNERRDFDDSSMYVFHRCVNGHLIAEREPVEHPVNKKVAWILR